VGVLVTSLPEKRGERRGRKQAELLLVTTLKLCTPVRSGGEGEGERKVGAEQRIRIPACRKEREGRQRDRYSCFVCHEKKKEGEGERGKVEEPAISSLLSCPVRKEKRKKRGGGKKNQWSLKTRDPYVRLVVCLGRGKEEKKDSSGPPMLDDGDEIKKKKKEGRKGEGKEGEGDKSVARNNVSRKKKKE